MVSQNSQPDNIDAINVRDLAPALKQVTPSFQLLNTISGAGRT